MVLRVGVVRCKRRRERIHEGVYKRSVAHVVRQVRRPQVSLDPARAKQVRHTPDKALHAVGTAGDVDPESASQPVLGRHVVVADGIAVLQGGESRRVRRIGRMPGVLRQLADLGQAARRRVEDHRARVRELGAAVDERLEHRERHRIVVVAVAHERHERIATVELVVAHRVVAVQREKPWS